jgi:hypothetical protein
MSSIELSTFGLGVNLFVLKSAFSKHCYTPSLDVSRSLYLRECIDDEGCLDSADSAIDKRNLRSSI